MENKAKGIQAKTFTSIEMKQKSWPEIMDTLGYNMREVFRNDNMSFMNCLGMNTSVTAVMNSCYKCLIRAKKIPPIEELPLEEKQRLFLIIKDFAPEGSSKEYYISCCSALHALEYYLNT